MKDPYRVLGVEKTATQDEIKNAYRNLAKKCHPDLNPGNKIAEAKFKDASSAYEHIGTPEARGKFDRGETPEQQQAQAQKYSEEQSRASQAGGRSFYYDTQQDGGRYSYSFGKDVGGDEFFENLFRSAGQTKSQKSKGRTGGIPSDFPGEDRIYQMSVSFKDAVLGTQSEVTLPDGKRLQVNIPPGVETGTQLRFKGQGGPGIGQGTSGDAYVTITVKPLPGFKRVGSEIETELPISFIEALLGAEIKAPTIEGTVMLKVPPGVSTGSRLRLRGQGIPIAQGRPLSRGDQIVTLKVCMPKKIDPALSESAREWEKKYSYNPREAS